jgi:hypothetical protein
MTLILQIAGGIVLGAFVLGLIEILFQGERGAKVMDGLVIAGSALCLAGLIAGAWFLVARTHGRSAANELFLSIGVLFVIAAVGLVAAGVFLSVRQTRRARAWARVINPGTGRPYPPETARKLALKRGPRPSDFFA